MHKIGTKGTITVTCEIVELDPQDDDEPYRVRITSGPEEGEKYWLSRDQFAPSQEEVPAEPVLSDSDMELFGIGPDHVANQRRQMALHHAMDMHKAAIAAGYSPNASAVVEAAKEFQKFLAGE